MLTMATIPAVVAVVTIKSSLRRPRSLRRQTLPPPGPTAMSQPATTEIAPAPVIDPKGEVFTGPGDQSAGFWVKL
jgi:hypothetical protein